MTKIAFDEQIFNQKYGGISRYYCNLTCELSNLGSEPKIFAGYYISNYLKEIENKFKTGTQLNSYPKKLEQTITKINRLSNIIKINKCQTQKKTIFTKNTLFQ